MGPGNSAAEIGAAASRQRGSGPIPDATHTAGSLRREATAPGAARRAVFGIKFKLNLALSVLATLTVIAGTVAWSIFHDMHRSLTQVTHYNVQSMATAVQLVELGGEISATASAIVASSTDGERQRERLALHRIEREFAALIEKIDAAQADDGAVPELVSIAGRISGQFKEIDAVVERSLALQVERQKTFARLVEAHDRLVDAVDFSLVALDAEGSGPAIPGAHALFVEFRRSGELAADLLHEAAVAQDRRSLASLSERFAPIAQRLERIFDDLPEEGRDVRLRAAVDTIVDLGTGEASVFRLRQAEIETRSATTAALADVRAREAELGAAVARLVDSVHEDSDAATAQSTRMIDNGELVMIVVTVASGVIALAVMFFYVGRRIIRPIEQITHAMTELAGGDTTVDIPGRSRRDELGRMTQALGVFRDTAIEVQKSSLREIQATQRRLSDAIESISEAFSLYGPDDRLVVCNQKYRTLLYPDIAEEILPGTSFADLIRRAAERGYIKDAEGRVEAWIEERLARHGDPGEPHLQQRGDGRWVMVSERKTQEGGTVAVYSDITDLKEREQELAEKSAALEQLSAQLSKYLSPQVYQSIFTGRQEVKLASRRKKLTIFFSDIAAFTETTDRLESEELTTLLNHYLTEMSNIALTHGATIDKYVGDAIVIFFGDPESRGVKEDALACVRMSIAMRQRMGELEHLWRASGIGRPLQSRMGINTGYCTVGNFGSEDRLDYTVIGGAVNLTSRLETAAESGEILISYETYALVNDEIACEELEPIQVKGLPHPVVTYRVIDSRENLGQSAGLIAEQSENMNLQLDPGAMSPDELARAAVVLKTALDRVSRGK